MSDYKIVKLLELEDVVGDRAEGVEGRFGRTPLESRDLAVSHWRYGAGVRGPFNHSHREQEEAYVVISGSGRMRLDDEIHEIVQWDVIRVAPQVIRSFEGGPDGLEMIAVGGPKPEDGDGVPDSSPWPE